MRARYLGPCIVVSRNRGGAYIIAELDGVVFDWPVAAFQVIPYFAWAKILLPPLDSLIDISIAWLRQMEASEAQDLEDDDNEVHGVPPMDDD